MRRLVTHYESSPLLEKVLSGNPCLAFTWRRFVTTVTVGFPGVCDPVHAVLVRLVPAEPKPQGQAGEPISRGRL